MRFSFFNREPNADEISAWLKNFADDLGKWGTKKLAEDRTSHDLLVCGGLIPAALSADKIVREFAGIAPKMGQILQQLRAYYECLWYITLLWACTTPEDRTKVSKLYGMVDLRTMFVVKDFFDSNPRIKGLLGCAFFDFAEYHKTFQTAYSEYINGQFPIDLVNDTAAALAFQSFQKMNRQQKFPPDPKLDLLEANAEALTFKIFRAAALDVSVMPTLWKILTRDTIEAVKLKFLTQFDFEHCNPVGLPESFLQK